MTINEVLAYYKTAYKMHVETGISCSNVTYWNKIGFVPYKMQLRIEDLTRGKLKASIKHTDYQHSAF